MHNLTVGYVQANEVALNKQRWAPGGATAFPAHVRATAADAIGYAYGSFAALSLGSCRMALILVVVRWHQVSTTQPAGSLVSYVHWADLPGTGVPT